MPFNRFRTADGTQRRHRARPGDALHRRGDGLRRRPSARRSPRRRRRRSAALPIERHGVRVGGQPRQAAHDLPDQAAGRPRLRDPRDRRARPRCCAATACRRRSSASTQPGRRARRRADDRAGGSWPARSTWSSTPRTARPRAARRASTATRSAPPSVATQHPLHHHGAGPRRRRAGHRGAAGGHARRPVAAELGAGRRDRATDGDRARSPRRDARPAAGHGRGASRSSGSATTTTSRSSPTASPSAPSPGNFVALAVGGETSATLLRRAFSIYRVRPAGVYGGTVEIVFAAHGKGTALAGRAGSRTTRSTSSARWAGRSRCRKEPVACALVGGGYGIGAAVHARRAAARARLRRAHRARRGDRDDSCSARSRPSGRPSRSPSRPSTARSASRAWSPTRCPTLIDAHQIEVVYSCGPMGMLRPSPRSRSSTAPGARRAVEESMACGIGVCMTCVLPVRRRRRRHPDGPLLRRGPGLRAATRCAGTTSAPIPPDTLGAPQAGGALMPRRRCSARTTSTCRRGWPTRT